MKITVQSRLALLAGLLLVALIVFATGLQAAQAATVAGSGAGPGTASFTTPTQPQGSTAVRHDARAGRAPQGINVSTAQSGSSSATSGNAWIAAGSAAAALILIAAGILVRRRRQPSGRPSPAYCAQHPEDPLCMTT
jgi:hypothetical protein